MLVKSSLLVLIPAVLATKDGLATHNNWRVDTTIVSPVDNSTGSLSPPPSGSFESRVELERTGTEQLALTHRHRIGRQVTGHGGGVGKVKRGKGEGKRGQIRTVARRASCPTGTGGTGGASSTTTSSTTTTKAKPTTTTKGGSKPTTTTTTKGAGTTTTKGATTSQTTTTTTTSKTTKTTTKTTSTPSPTSKVTVDPAGNGPFTGWGTWYDVGLGACGWWNNPGDPIVAVSQQLFDNWPGYNGLNPNVNPICGHHLAITWGGKTVIAEVADYCPGCAERSLDMSKGLFEAFADLDVGLLGGDNYTPPITWKWVEGTGSLPALPVS